MIDLNELTLGQLKQIQTLLGTQALAEPAPASAANAPERAVMVTTEFRGVFFGYATKTDGDPIRLKRARNCIYWTSDEKGFLGLASTGPGKGCKIGPPVTEIELRKITSVVEVSEAAIAAWESAPWQK